MMSWLIPWLLFSLIGIFFIFSTWFMLASSWSRPKASRQHFFLPHDLFTALIVLTSFWGALILILGAHLLADREKQLVITVAALCAPFLSWWHKKKSREAS